MKKIKVIMFDLGGTLINYEGLPQYWGDYYKSAFQNVKEKLNIDISEKQIDESIKILKKFNPRLYPRDVEYDSEYIFSHVTKKFIGDEEKDIKTSKNAGCASVFINRSGEIKNYGQDYEIKALTEVLDILE